MMHRMVGLADTPKDYLIQRPSAPSSGVSGVEYPYTPSSKIKDIDAELGSVYEKKVLDNLFWETTLSRDASLTQALSCLSDKASVCLIGSNPALTWPQAEVRTDTFQAHKETNILVFEDMVGCGIVVKMPPKRRYTISGRVRNIKRGNPVFVEPELHF